MTDQQQKGHAMFDMRKASVLVAAGALVASLGLAGCGGDQTGTTETKVDDATTGKVSDDTTKDDGTGTIVTTDTETTTWTDVAGGAEASEQAGLEGGFVVPDALVAHGIDFSDPKFSWTPLVAKATYDQPASAVEIRKGLGPAGTVRADDGTGWLGEDFKEAWDVTTPDGVRVTCHGDTQGKIIFAQWYDNSASEGEEPVTLNGHTAGDASHDLESYAYSVHAMGLGGEDIPMTEEELLAIVAAVQ